MESRGPPSFRDAFLAAAVFLALVLVFTVLGVFFGPSGSQVGSTRPAGTIPTHLGDLLGVGVLLGLGAALFYGRRGLPFVALAPALTVALDLDHLPVYLGYAQPIRPAHSMVFMAIDLALTTIIIRRIDFDLVVTSAIMGHMGVDTGLFAPFSPLSFDYVQLDPYRVPLLVGAVVTAVAAGVLLRRRTPKET